MALVKSPKECLVCLNSSETTFVTSEESQKIFNICCSYVQDAINIEFLINNINGNNNQLSFCKNCLESSKNLYQLVEKLSNLKKQINDLSSSFSETIAAQRNRATIKSSKKHTNNRCTQFSTNNNQNANLDSLDSTLLNDFQESSETKSLGHLKVSRGLRVEKEIAVEAFGDEIVKTENDGIFPDFEHSEDERCNDNGSGHNVEECEPNYIVSENEHESDPLGETELQPEPTYRFINNCNHFLKTILNETATSTSELVSSDTKPNIILRVGSDTLSSRDDTFLSTNIETSRQIKPTVNYTNTNHADGSGSFNCKAQTTIVKHKASKMKKRRYTCCVSICGKSFYTYACLKRHNLTHTGERPFKCHMCEKAFTQSNALQIHERIHTGERPYQCPSCPSAFVALSGLKYHERSHRY